MTHFKAFLKHLFALLVVIYVSVSLLVYTMPQFFFYHPDTNKPDIVKARREIPALNEVSYKTADGRDVYAWYTAPTTIKKGVIFMHGNSYNIGYFLDRVKPFIAAGYAVIMPEYEGFGGIPGKPSQKNMESDMAATVNFLNEHGVKNENIVLYGYSLGTYMATYTAAKLKGENPFNALVLEAPFTSLKNVAAEKSFHLFPLSILMRDKYNSYGMVDKTGTRTFIAHGTIDPTVPYHMGQEMFEKATGNKVFYGVEGADHRNLPTHGFLDEVIKWLDHTS